MSRKFNGTTDYMTASPALNAFSLLTVSYWMWWDTNANDDDFACEYGASYITQNGFVVDHNSSSGGGGKVEFGMGLNTGSVHWSDLYTRPSAGVWHHYMYVMNRATPVNKAWVDGVSQSLTTASHGAGTYGNYGTATLFLMAHYTIWGGVELGTNHALALAGGAPPEMVWPAGISWRAPLWGVDSPEPDYSGRRLSATVTAGTTWAPDPPVMPRLNRSNRTYQSVPA